VPEILTPVVVGGETGTKFRECYCTKRVQSFSFTKRLFCLKNNEKTLKKGCKKQKNSQEKLKKVRKKRLFLALEGEKKFHFFLSNK
jgi:hypothetical protein